MKQFHLQFELMLPALAIVLKNIPQNKLIIRNMNELCGKDSSFHILNEKKKSEICVDKNEFL